MTTTFHYRSIPGAMDGQRRPNIPVVLKWGNLAVATAALLDSGADTIVLPRSIAETLGLDLTGEKTPSSGIGGTANCIKSDVSLKVMGKGPENAQFFQAPVLVIDSNKEVPVLLGRNGFFSRYVITIDEQERHVTLKPKNVTGVKY